MSFLASSQNDDIWLVQATSVQVALAWAIFVRQVLSLLVAWSGDYCMQMVSNNLPRKQQVKEPWASSGGPGMRDRIKGAQEY